MGYSQCASEETVGSIPTSEEEWNCLRKKLQCCIWPLITSYRVTRWTTCCRQELVDDMTQQTILQALAYAYRAERGEVPAINSFEALCITTIRHCLIDRARKDHHPLLSLDDILVGQLYDDTRLSVEDLAIERADRLTQLEFLSSLLVRYVTYKQRVAFLTEVANNSDLDEKEPCLWQQALHKYGIELAAYRHEIPDDAKSRSRHRADLWLARHKLMELARLELQSGRAA